MKKYVIDYWPISQEEFETKSLDDLAKQHPCPPVGFDWMYDAEVVGD